MSRAEAYAAARRLPVSGLGLERPMTKEEALVAAIRALHREAAAAERHAAHNGNSEVAEYARHLREVVTTLQGAGGIGGATFQISSDQARMLMNYIDRAHMVDQPVLRASVEFDEDEEGALEQLLKDVVAECRSAWLRSVIQKTES